MFVYFDSISIVSRSFEEYMKYLQKVLQYLEELELKLMIDYLKHMWPDLQKHDIMMTHFEFCISEFHIPKALFCHNINDVLQIIFKLQS